MKRALPWLVCTVVALAACGTVSKNEGGYYKDDGPPDRVPSNLAQAPDAMPRWEPLHRFANRPYEVLGRKYTPFTQLRPYKERGIATWYGKRFQGKPTSSGEPYDMYAMTAAHRVLAIPSYARVTNLGNGRSVVVRINDRGPFQDGRLIDLSFAAAYKLGYVGQGRARVEVEAIIPSQMSTGPRLRPLLHAAAHEPEG